MYLDCYRTDKLCIIPHFYMWSHVYFDCYTNSYHMSPKCNTIKLASRVHSVRGSTTTLAYASSLYCYWQKHCLSESSSPTCTSSDDRASVRACVRACVRVHLRMCHTSGNVPSDCTFTIFSLSSCRHVLVLCNTSSKTASGGM